MKYLVLAAALLLGGPVVAAESEWTTSTTAEGWAVSQFDFASKQLILICKGNQQRELVFGIPASFVDGVTAELKYVDLVMEVTGRDDSKYTQLGVAASQPVGDRINYVVTGDDAWGLMSAIGYSNSVGIGVSPRYVEGDPQFELFLQLNTRNGQTEKAVFAVLGPCAPPKSP